MRRAFAVWRVGAAGLMGVLFVLLGRTRPVRGRAAWTALPFFMAALALMAAMLGRRDGLDSPWFHGLLFFLMLPSIAPETLGVRVAYAGGLCLAIVGGFFGFNPQNLDSPWLGSSLANMLALAATSVVAGHVVHRRAVVSYFQGARIDAQRAELEALNVELDARVQAQTADLRALSEHLQSVRERERAHLARELHDDLGQRLAATRYAVAAVRRTLDPAGAAQLDEVAGLLGDAAQVAHGIVGGLRPPLLDALGLHGACAWLTRQMAERAELAWEHTPAGDDADVDEDVALAIYRALQEALTNVTRHAGATRVAVATSLDDRSVTLTVTDDGVGLPASPAAPAPGRGGVGLIGLRERARALGGDLDLRPGPAGGLRLLVRLPRRRPEETA